jgi:hypothetical protein
MTDDYPTAEAYIDTDEQVLYTEVRTADGTVVHESSVNLEYATEQQLQRAIAGQYDPLYSAYAVQINGEEERDHESPEELDDVTPDG